MNEVPMPWWIKLVGRFSGYGVLDVAGYIMYLSAFGAKAPDPGSSLYVLQLSRTPIYVSALQYWIFITLLMAVFLCAIVFVLGYFSVYVGQKR